MLHQIQLTYIRVFFNEDWFAFVRSMAWGKVLWMLIKNWRMNLK